MKYKNKILILGGSGFVGKHLVNSFLLLGWEVTSVNYKKTFDYLDKVTCIQMDLSIKSELYKIANTEYDYIVNLTGYIDHSNYFNGGQMIINNHLTTLYNIVNTISRKKLKRFIHIGSSDEYGNITAPQSESMQCLPFSPYSYSKFSATNFLLMLHLNEKFPVTIIRPFLIYGPGQDVSRFLPQLINACLNKNNHFQMTKGEQLRDYCYISDVINAIILIINSKKFIGDIVNIGSGIPISIKSVTELVCSIFGVNHNFIIDTLPYRENENMALFADITKITNGIGWSPKITINEGLTLTINNLIKDGNK
jgi:nucleoside-diphosphate-sugar epimerase